MRVNWMHKLFSRCAIRILGATFIVLALLNVVEAACGDKDKGPKYRTQLFGRKFSLDNDKELAAYIKALGIQIERSKKEEKQGDTHQTDPLHNNEPDNYIDKSIRKSMGEARECAMELSHAGPGSERDRLLKELDVMAGAIRASYMSILPPSMDVFQALRTQSALRHPMVGLGKDGLASNTARGATGPSEGEPFPPSSFWTRPQNIAGKDLYYGFDRTDLPNLNGEVCVYRRSKQSRGVHGGLDVKCETYGKVKLKFGEEFSQPFAHRIFWALGFNTTPVDCVRSAKVKWDRRIFTEFNTRKDEGMSVRFLGIPIHSERMQHYLDPLTPVTEIVMLDEQGKVVSIKPEHGWDDFKAKLYKNPRGKPETVRDNFNDAFADRIHFLVYKTVNFREKDDEDTDKGSVFLGNWDWNGEDNPSLRENRGFAFVSAWLSQFDSWVHNNKIYMTKNDGQRTFKRVVTDLGGSLGPATDASKMIPQAPNQFPWSFTRPARSGESAIPLDGSFHNIRDNKSLRAADIYDARWIAPYMAQITGKQILEALVASGMPSAHVRLFFNKLVHRRNKALADIGLSYPPIKQMDENERFNYDPLKDGLVSVVTSRNEKVSAPDDGWVVVNGRAYTRAQVESGEAVKYDAKIRRS